MGGQIKYKFKTLLTYGRVVSVLGWVLIVTGIILVVAGLVSVGDKDPSNIYDLVPLVVSLSALPYGIQFVLVGFTFVLLGQMISCFVQIERNTHLTNEILNAQHGGTQ